MNPDRCDPSEALTARMVTAPTLESKAIVSNVLSEEKRLAVLTALVDGCSVSTVSRLTEVNRRTITRLLLAFGAAAQRLHDRLVRDLTCALVQFDEIWSYVGKKRRLCYAFSRKPSCHRAAVALDYVAYNLTHVVRTLRVTPAMQSGIVDHVWTLAELLDALLTEEPVEAPQAQPLAHREPEAPSRALPEGRGFLRLVTEPMPARRHAPGVPDAPPPPATPAAPVEPTSPGLTKVRGPEQLSLFDPPEGA